MLRIVLALKIGRRYGFSSNRFSKHPVCYHGLCGDSCPHAHRLHCAGPRFPCLRCHLPQSHVSDQLIAAYRSANYRVESSCETFVLRIDQYSEPLARLFAASGRHCAAFVTAFNPLGTLQTFEANQAASARLAGRLGQLARGEGRVFAGAGSDLSGTWPEEKSFLVLGLDLDAARALGREFNQNAIVWAGNDAIPRLVLLH